MDSVFRQPSVSENWYFDKLKDILENPPASTPIWKICGMVSPSCPTQVSSLPHGMKSFSWLQGSIEAALSRPVWDHFAVDGVKKTLFLETEDPRWLVQQRVVNLAKGLGIKPGDVEDAGCFVLGTLGPFDLVRAETEVRKVLDKYAPDFCVLSTLQGLLAGRDWNKQNEMADVNSLLVRLSATYCPIITITHSPQDKKQKRAAGTVTQAANYPNILHYEKFSTDRGTFSRVYIDSKLGYSDRFRLRLEHSENSALFRWERDTVKGEIRAFLDQNPDISSAEAAAQFDVSERYIRKLKAEK